MVLLINNFAVDMSAVGVVTIPGYSILLPPTVSLVRCDLSLCGLCATTMLPYVASALRVDGISEGEIKRMVLEPV